MQVIPAHEIARSWHAAVHLKRRAVWSCSAARMLTALLAILRLRWAAFCSSLMCCVLGLQVMAGLGAGLFAAAASSRMAFLTLRPSSSTCGPLV